MTPRDELRERAEPFLLHDEACESAHDDGPGACDCIVQEIRTALAASQPAGEGDWRWTVTVDADGNLRGLGDLTAATPPSVVERSGLRAIEVSPVSSSAGDEAREALERALARFDERDLHVADEDYEAVFAAARLVVSSPLPGAGDGRRAQEMLAAEAEQLDRDCTLLSYANLAAGVEALVYEVAPFPLPSGRRVQRQIRVRTVIPGGGGSALIVRAWTEPVPAPADEETTR